jgi:Domain of unknown function (DUF4160)
MPRIAAVEGVVIYIYFDEHVPPHFHAVFAEFEASIAIETLAIVEGSLPAAKLKRTLIWARTNQDEITEK